MNSEQLRNLMKNSGPILKALSEKLEGPLTDGVKNCYHSDDVNALLITYNIMEDMRDNQEFLKPKEEVLQNIKQLNVCGHMINFNYTGLQFLNTGSMPTFTCKGTWEGETPQL